MPRTKEVVSHYLREVVFGLEDSLVSTLGAVSGVAIGSRAGDIVILTGLVLVAVEALSMAAGSYLSSEAASDAYKARAAQDSVRMLSERVSDTESLKDLLSRKGFSKGEIQTVLLAIGRERKLWLKEIARNEYRMAPSVTGVPIIAAGMMGVFYLAGGLFVVLPYLIFPLSVALWVAPVMSVSALVGLGFLKALLTGTSRIKSVAHMVLISATAAVLGMIVGSVMAV